MYLPLNLTLTLTLTLSTLLTLLTLLTLPTLLTLLLSTVFNMVQEFGTAVYRIAKDKPGVKECSNKLVSLHVSN